MLQNPTSAATLPRLDAEKEGVQPSIRPLLAARRPRPRAAVGTCPYHWWLTSFGAEVIGAKPPERWSEDLANVRTVGALSGLWLGLREHGPAVGLTLTGWRRLPDGLSYRDPRTGIHVPGSTYRDPRTGAGRRLAVDAGLNVRLGGMDVRALVFARIDRVPRARLGSVLARWAAFLAPAASAASERVPIAALVLTRTQGQRATILDAARDVVGANDRVAVGAVEPGGVALATDVVWRTAADEYDRRLVEVLASIAKAGK